MKKLLVVGLGLIFALLLLEIILRVLGLMQEGDDKLDIGRKIDGAGYSILCLGDSFTRGVGAPAGDDYPSQLQSMIDSSGYSAKVVNRGIPGKNSTQILNTFKNDLLTFKPDLIVLLTGGANNWNYYGYGSSTTSNAFNDIFYRIRVFKLVKLLIENLSDKGSNEDEIVDNHLDQEGFDKLIREFEASINVNPNNGAAYYKVGDFYMYEQNVVKAVEWFQKGINADPQFTDNYLNLAMAYHAIGMEKEARIIIDSALANPVLTGKNKLFSYMATYYMQNERYRDILDIIQKAFQANSISRDLYEVLIEITGKRNGNSMKRSKMLANNDSLRNNAILLLEKFPPENSLEFAEMPSRLYQAPLKTELMLSADRRLISNWIMEDIKKIIEICEENEISIIIQNYPIRGSQWTHLSKSYKLANDAISRVVFENNIPLVDNQSAFTALGEKQGEYLEAPGGGEHCNSKGYRFMAENAYSVILKEKFLVSK